MLLTIPQAAKQIALSRQRVWRLVRDGKIKAQQVGPQWLIKASDLEQFQQSKAPA